MKKLNLSLAGILFLAMITLFSCKKADSPSLVSGAKGGGNSGSTLGDYLIIPTVSADGTVWTYTITRTKPSAKNLSHLIINLQNCGDQSATFANIVSATVNGAPADMRPTEGSGTGCDPQASTTNFVKINFSAATSWVVVITYERGYSQVSSNVWVKAGTSCNQGTILAPGCPLEDYCSFSQGFFFANGTTQNGATDFWVNGLTIGGVTYTQLQGNTFWGIDKGKGGDQTMNGFFQLGAARLSGAEGEVSAEATVIDAYFSGLDVASKITNAGTYLYFNLPAVSNGVTKAAVTAAGSAIGAFIEANHCD